MTELNRDEKAIFLTALDKESPEEQTAFLEQACSGDQQLLARVKELLAAHEGSLGPLDAPPPGVGHGVTVDAPVLESVGTMIGPYKLREKIGEGGMGVVYVAEQKQPVKRRVALKIIKPGMDSHQVIARFEAERQALAIMDHPNIAKVLDAGTTDRGLPYFVMELVNGLPITRYCDEQHLEPRQRLELFIGICQAVQHAHQKGIIHRDLKPSNILVALYDGRPVPKVIDFGVAKATGQTLSEKSVYTQLGQLVGTLEYMSPEQAQRNQLDIDTRSDVYSLGVVLYELLTGETPFERKRLRSAAFDEMLRIIREEEPPKPSTKISSSESLPSVAANRHMEPQKLSALVRGELDWIVMKALEKDRHRRYETANGFANDIKRYLNDEPVVACPPSARYRLGKFVRRNKAALSVAGFVLLFLMLLGSGIGWAVRDQAARQSRVSEQVELLLADVDALTHREQWDEALATVRRAEAAIVGGEAGSPVRDKVQTALSELQFVARLSEIRMEMSATKEDEFDYAGAVRSYGQAFRNFGIDVQSLPVAQAVALLKQHPRIIVPVASALDGFVYARRSALGSDDTEWRQLMEIAREIDPDPVRDQLRALWGAKIMPETQAVLRELAASYDVRKHSAGTAVQLARMLRQLQLVELQEQILRRAQRVYPGDFWVNHNLGNLLRQRGEFAEAVRFHSAALAIKPDNAGAHNNLGIALAYHGKLDEAIACYRTAIELDPKGDKAHNNLGLALTGQDKLDEAIAEFRTAIELDPEFSASQNNLGTALRKQGKHEEAIAELQRAIELNPKYAGAHNNLGNVLRDQGKLEEAIDCYRTAIKLDPNDAKARNNLGIALRKTGELEEAITELRRAIELDPKIAAAHYNLGDALRDQRKLDEAATEYRRTIELAPESAIAHLGLGSILVRQDKFEEAIANLHKAVELAPNLVIARRNLAIAHANWSWSLATDADERQRDPVRAVELATEATELEPDDANNWCTLGVAEYRVGGWQASVDAFRQADVLIGGRGDRQHRLFLAMAHWQLGSQTQAREAYVQAITWLYERNVNGGEQIRFRDEAEQLMGIAAAERTAIVLAGLTRAIEAEPENVELYRTRGKILTETKQWQRAVDNYSELIRLEPKNVDGYWERASVYLHQRNWEGMIEDCTTMIKLDPQSRHYVRRGWVHSSKNDFDLAISDFNEAIRINPEHWSAYGYRGWAYWYKQQFELALKDANHVLEKQPWDANYLLGHIHLAQGDHEHAIRAFQRAIEFSPESNWGYNMKGWAQLRGGRIKDASATINRAVELAISEDDRLGAFCCFFSRASLHLAQGNRTEAMADFRATLQAFDESLGLDPALQAEEALTIAITNWHLGKHEQAREHYAKAVELIERWPIGRNQDVLRLHDEAKSLLETSSTAEEKSETND